uniref:WDHD1/CFT4 second beta-propeller domain-containing protein n=1 Tax=Brassica campestris TaxID=3711 RepID=A0A3P5YGQ7_BRACM|nr:unnamed protein product [Brassica rapa]
MKWTMRFEEVKVVANGSGLVAAITSLNLLHIFSEGGLQVSSFAFYGLSCVTIDKHVISLGGPVVTATGCRDQLAVVTHVSDCLPSNEQVGIVLYFLLFHRRLSKNKSINFGYVLLYFFRSESDFERFLIRLLENS